MITLGKYVLSHTILLTNSLEKLRTLTVTIFPPISEVKFIAINPAVYEISYIIKIKTSLFSYLQYLLGYVFYKICSCGFCCPTAFRQSVLKLRNLTSVILKEI